MVTIGNQAWMTENLKTSKFSDGSPIEYRTGPDTWELCTTSVYGLFQNSTVNKAIYGALNNAYAASSGK